MPIRLLHRLIAIGRAAAHSLRQRLLAATGTVRITVPAAWAGGCALLGA